MFKSGCEKRKKQKREQKFIITFALLKDADSSNQCDILIWLNKIRQKKFANSNSK
jgi:hypothetical protein